jgi:N-methylhydantoinase A/oxoprolinase/acetone carboxylase beta subunit
MEISISSEVTLLIREYARFNSTIINLFIGRPVRKLFSKIENRLQDNGYNKPLFAMQAAGGLSRTDVIQPITTLHSGPVGGLVGVEFFKDIYGCKNAMGSDVGGTSFDISVVTEEGAKYLREPVVSRFHLANPMREIISIGAGGGTIAHIDKLTRELRLGPQSAGSVPGPVCYGKGGTEPTVTDADVVMNRIDPDYFLGGKMKLDKQMAEKAIKEKIADPLGMDLMEAAHGICSIIDNIMASIISSTMGERGLDPEEFLLFGFGGAGPAHCAGYSAGLGFQKVVIPPYASTFSAFGASTADVRHRYAMSPNLIIPSIKFNVGDRRFNLTSLDELPKGIVETFNRVNDEFEQKAYAEMQEEGFNKDNIKMAYTIEARYGSQKWEIVAPIPITRIKNVEDMKELLKWYENEYERLYGSEAKFPEGGLEIITMALEASGSMMKPKITKSAYVGEDASPALKGERNVFFVNRFLKTKIYEMKELKNGNVINGPAIIEGVDTTVVVPEDRNITVDEYLNMIMN